MPHNVLSDEQILILRLACSNAAEAGASIDRERFARDLDALIDKGFVAVSGHAVTLT